MTNQSKANALSKSDFHVPSNSPSPSPSASANDSCSPDYCKAKVLAKVYRLTITQLRCRGGGTEVLYRVEPGPDFERRFNMPFSDVVALGGGFVAEGDKGLHDLMEEVVEAIQAVGGFAIQDTWQETTHDDADRD